MQPEMLRALASDDIDDSLFFAEWLDSGFVRKSAEGAWCITPHGDTVLWAMRLPGDRERHLSRILDENVLGILSDFDVDGSMAAVVAKWNLAVAIDGILISELDMYRTIVRWKLNPPIWFDDSIQQRLCKINKLHNLSS